MSYHDVQISNLSDLPDMTPDELVTYAEQLQKGFLSLFEEHTELVERVVAIATKIDPEAMADV